MTNKSIYLDYNATTPVDPRVLECMLPYFVERFGNASSHSHAFGWEAEEAVDIAREQVAGMLDAKPGEIYFTSGATEALNLALLGICNEDQSNGNHIVTCRTEHKAVLDTCLYLEKRGYNVTWLEVDAEGQIDLDELKDAIRSTTALICVMHANNETGVLHPIAEIAAIAEAHHVPLLTDATQSVGKLALSVRDTPISLLAFSAHKLYGPKGIGALYVKNSVFPKINPLMHGGGQQRGLRPGTPNVPAIVGFGKACELCAKEMANEAIRLSQWRNHLEQALLEIPGTQANGTKAARLPHTTSITFPQLNGEQLLRALPALALSQGSACTSATVAPSHVLLAMGLSDEQALASIRIGLGRWTTQTEVDMAIRSLKSAVHQLFSASV